MFDPKNLKKIVLVLLVLIAITIAFGYFYYQKNVFGQDKIYFEITAPENMVMGEEIEYIIRYKNNSETRLEDVVLTFEYPENAIIIEEENEAIQKRGDVRREVTVGELNPGEEKTVIFKARLLGQKGDSLETLAWLRYVPKNLAAKYEIKRTHTAIINSVPINFEFQVPSSVDPEQESSFRLRFSSNIDYPLTDLEVQLKYPTEFEFIRSTPKTDSETKNLWTWAVLNNNEDGIIDFDGILKGESGDAKIFSATLGIWKGDKYIVLSQATKGTAISQSSLLLDMQVNGVTDHVATPGELLHYEVFYRNVGEETLENLFLLVNLDKDTLNFNQLETTNGRFQEDRGVIIWSYTFDFALQSLQKNEEGKVDFWVRVREDLPYNPEIKVEASMENAKKTLATKVNTVLSLNQEVIRMGSPFEEVGPFPFEKGAKSNYAVRWRIKSQFNDVRDVTIKTVLPVNAKITGEKEPEEGILSFNPGTREVILEIDSLSAGVAREIFFEVETTPSEELDEKDWAVFETEMIARDRRTDRIITQKVGAVFLDQILEISI
jgi:hypothetical protein